MPHPRRSLLVNNLCFALTAVLAATVGAAFAQSGSPNLVPNSSFEFGPKGGGPPQDWEAAVPAPGGATTRDITVARTGQASLRIFVPQDAPVNWYQASQDCGVRRVGDKFTLSIYVRTSGIHDGAGAYISIGYFDSAGARISYYDSDGKLTGDNDWKRLTTTGTVPDHATVMRIIAVVHGHGTAWFDDVQLEAGEKATDYRPSQADLDTVAEQQAQMTAAAAFAQASHLTRHVGRDVAVLNDTIPAVGKASSPVLLAETLRKAGFAPQYLRADELANPSILSTDHFDLLVLPYGASFPAKAAAALRGFLASGGSFFSTGGYAFDAPMISVGGKWYDQTRLPNPPGTHRAPVFSFDGDDALKGWGQTSYRPGNPKMTLEREGDWRYLKATTTDLQRWDCVTSPRVDRSKLPADWSVTVLRAKGDANTRKLAIEWQEADASRWKTVIDLTPEWKEYRIPHTMLTYWQDNPSMGRGGPTDHFRPENATVMQIGIAEDIAPAGGNYSFCIADIRVEDDPLRAERMTAVQINTRIGPIHDALFPAADQIGVFDPANTLEQVAFVKSLPTQKIIPTDIRLNGSLEGFAATAMLGLNGHGFGPDRARIVPLVMSFDRFTRQRGPVGSIVHNFTGYFQGSSWAIFGADSVDLFDAKHPQMLAALPQIAEAVTRKLYLHGTEAEYACYQPGEAIKLLSEVSNFGPEPRRARVLLEVRRNGVKQPLFAKTFPVEVKPGDTQHLETSWTPPTNPDDIYFIRTTLLDGIAELDREDNAVIIWNDAVAKAGLPIKMEDTYFKLGGKPTFLMGNQNWWGQMGSVSARSPLKMLQDYSTMQDNGLHFSRCFLPWGDERAKRTSDAWVYLAQRHKIVLFHTPNLFNSMDNDEQAKQEKWAREIGERYRKVPGLVVDISNEPYFVIDNNDQQRARFNEYLKAKYGTDAALKAAWPLSPPEKPMPNVPSNPPSDTWGDMRAFDVLNFAMDRQGEWARKLREQFKAGAPDMPISVGFMQGFGWRGSDWDPINNSLDQDFTDRHYYGDLSVLPAEIKEIDQRWMGKPLTIGECGAKCHPSFDNGNMGEDPETFARRFLWMGHHTFGMGGAFMASWHWRDPMEGIFPCGLVRSDFVPRLARSTMRNMAILFSCMHPKYDPPTVFVLEPDLNRTGARRDVVIRGVRRSIDLLIGLRVNFGVISERSLPKLPDSAQVIVYPIPYAMSDATFEALQGFVSRGGKLYVSGDISYDPSFQRTKTDRLKTLCGVELVGENYPNMAFDTPGKAKAPVKILTLTNALDIHSFDGHPGITLKAAGAEALAEDLDLSPVIVANKVEKGGVFFVADPLELENADAVPQRDIYARFLKWAGVSTEAVTPDRPELQCFSLATEEGGAVHVFENTDKAAMTVQLPQAQGAPELELAPGLAGLLWQDKSGAPLAVEAQGNVRIAGADIARFEGHFAALSLDDAPLNRSQALLVLPFSEGTIELSSTLPAAQVAGEWGEISQGQWKKLDTAAVRMLEGKLTIRVPAEHRTSLLLIAPRNSFDTYSSALAAMVARR